MCFASSLLLAFRKHLSHELAQRAILKLKSSSESSWTVLASQIGRDIYLNDGWQEFIRDNSLGDFEFLVFRYNKHMHFTVRVFDKNCVERANVASLRTGESSTFSVGLSKRPSARPPTGNKGHDFATVSAKGIKSEGEELPSITAAASFKSKFPYFLRLIKPSMTVGIPTQFYKEKLYSRNYDEIILVTSQGKYNVKLIKRSYTMIFSAGWDYFRSNNKIKVGNLCIFEVVNENTMKVHNFRN